MRTTPVRNWSARSRSSLNTAYGIDWRPAFGRYEPSLPTAAAQRAAIELGAEVLELEPVEDAPEGRVY